MYKKNSLIFALGTKVIAVFPLCILLHVFMRNRKRVEEEKVMGMLDLGFLYLLLGVSFNHVGFWDGTDGCRPRAM